MFERLRAENPSALKKIKPIQGDVLFENLGLSDSEIETLSKEVTIIFHFAATLKLEAPLKDNVNMNTFGTKRALDVAKRFKNLTLFVHLSTAFCYPDYEVLDERVRNFSSQTNKLQMLSSFFKKESINFHFNKVGERTTNDGKEGNHPKQPSSKPHLKFASNFDRHFVYLREKK